MGLSVCDISFQSSLGEILFSHRMVLKFSKSICVISIQVIFCSFTYFWNQHEIRNNVCHLMSTCIMVMLNPFYHHGYIMFSSVEETVLTSVWSRNITFVAIILPGILDFIKALWLVRRFTHSHESAAYCNQSPTGCRWRTR